MPGFPKAIFRDAVVVEAFLCSVCTLVFRDAVQSPCGHRYCESCIKEIASREDKNARRCPACPASSADGWLVQDEIYPDFVARKELKGTRVRCTNDGCNWKGTLQEYSQDHEDCCPFERIKCLKSGCGKTLRRSGLSHHLEKECPMRGIECRNCKKQMPYKESKVRAYMLAAGDESRDVRLKKGPAGSLDMRALERELLRADRDVCKLRTDVERLIVARLAKELVEQQQSVIAMLAVLDRLTETLHQVLAVLSNQLDWLHPKSQVLERQNAQLRELADQQGQRLHAQEEMLSLHNLALAELELKVQSLEGVSFDGVLLWRVDNVRRRRQEAAFYSPVFYTSRHGYKLLVRLYPGGDGLGKQTHMSLFFVVMQGQYDALLPWPFRQKVTFMLMDQSGAGQHVVDSFQPDPNSSSFQRPTGDMNIASGCPLFISQDLLYAHNSNNSYIKDDVMFVKVVVDTHNLEKL